MRSLCDLYCLTAIRDPTPARLAHLSATEILPAGSAQAIDAAIANVMSQLAPHTQSLAAAASVVSTSTAAAASAAGQQIIPAQAHSAAVGSYWREGVLPLLDAGS